MSMVTYFDVGERRVKVNISSELSVGNVDGNA